MGLAADNFITRFTHTLSGWYKHVMLVALLVLGSSCASFLSSLGSSDNYTVEFEDPNVWSEYERIAFEDGQITYAEYSDATARTLACIADEGFSVNGPFSDETGRFLNFSAGYSVSPEFQASEDQRIQETMQRCDEYYLDAISATWARQTAPNEAELLLATKDFESCLREIDNSLIELPTLEDLYIFVDQLINNEVGLNAERARSCALVFQSRAATGPE